MGKNIRPEKLQDMIRSILPCKNRETARKAKALETREVRRTVRNDLRHVDFEMTPVDLTRDADQWENVSDRRAGDKLNHFMRWCRAITKGMTAEEALAYVRRILPRNLIGDHAYFHWKAEIRRDHFGR